MRLARFPSVSSRPRSSRRRAAYELLGILALSSGFARADADPASPSPEASTPDEASAAASPPKVPVLGVESSAPLDLQWRSAEPTCQGGEPVERAVARMLGARLPDGAMRARAEVREEGGRWQVRLETQTASHRGERKLEGRSCAEVRRAIALLLAMALEAEAREVAETPEPAATPPGSVENLDAPAATPVDPDAAAEDPVAPPGPPAARRSRWVVGAHLDVSTGLLPDPALGFGAALGASVEPLTILLGGTHWPEVSRAVPNSPATLRLTGWTAELSVCWRLLAVGNFSLSPCLVPQWTWLTGRVTGIDDERSNGRSGYGARVEADVSFTPTGGGWYASLRAGISADQELPFHLNTPAGCSESDEQCSELTVHRSNALSARLRAGLGLRF